ncbi:MAG TPA: putative sulfate/molybdate transporter [Deltaproteobacteria bacterium]|jgi:MFS superfamily sulfate permease-like transporter|nr:putative sulfate/molybdate transporter [Deltaproteobacteria bacterium]HQI00098.1 putative sulfate/molybdate transporter [Deltaproteobacteria bacterium]HQJ07766.1 putative sulfate/molybdate transporter [Deltaproteobacteria bacterium]
MKIKSFEFNLRELAGSTGDFGTLFPLAIGYIVVCGLNPAGFLVMMGLANIVTGLVYRLPMPIEPMKALAVVAIAQHWSPSMVYASGFAMGVIWLVFAVTGVIGWIARVTPDSVIRGIQVALGILLAVEAFKMISTWWAIGIASIFIVMLLRQNRYAPAAIVLMVLGVTIMFIKGQFQHVSPPAFRLPTLTGFSLEEVWQTLLLAGFAQIPLTVTNATIATSSLIKTYWPDKPVSVRRLSWSQGVMNVILPFFGGMPLCHGAGGLAGQYYFGARTGGTNIIEGLIEISLGLFLAHSIAGLFTVFPMAIIGAMMFLVGTELAKFAKGIRLSSDLFPMGMTIAVSLAANMAYGFLAGLIVYHLTRFIRKKGYCTCLGTVI